MTYKHIQQCMYLLILCIYVHMCLYSISLLMYLHVCVCICMYLSVSICMGMYLLVHNYTWHFFYYKYHIKSHISTYTTYVFFYIGFYMIVSMLMWYIYVCSMRYILYMQSLSGRGFEWQWEQCATPGLAPIPLDQLAWGLRWDLHFHPVHGNSYSPPKSVAKHTDMHISYLTFTTYTYRHIQTHTCNIDMVQTHTASRLSLQLITVCTSTHQVQVASSWLGMQCIR
jgi:hypothetical protein